MSAQEHHPGRWKAFTSLDWYDGTIEFLFRFVAKTSEPLLAAGIVYSAADVLSKGHLGSTNATMDNLWAISQALAIESSGGVVLVYGLESFKARDRVKAWMYLILSALLALTGGVMLFMQLAGLENQQADSLLMRSLFALRCVVSVGYIYLCRTKSMSFRNLEKEQPAAPAPPAPAPAQPATPPLPAPIDYQRLAQELAPMLQAVRTTIIEEVKASMTGPEASPAQRSQPGQTTRVIDAEKKQDRPRRAEISALPASERLEAAFQELTQANPGQRVSGRALAKIVHVDRQTCAAWLKAAHPEQMPGSHLAATTSQREVEVTVITDQPSVTATASHSEMETAATTDQTPLAATANHTEAAVTATGSRPELAATEPQPPVTATEPEERPEPELTVTTGQPEVTATNVQPGSTATATPSEAVAIVAETTTAASQLQAESEAIESQPEVTATDTALQPALTAAEPPPEMSAANALPSVAATETTIASRPEMEAQPTETATLEPPGLEVTATDRQPETTATASQLQPEVRATKNKAEREETATTSRPRKKAGATATRKTVRPRPKDTAIQPAAS
jgi:uncharacterized membrane protein